MSFVKFFDEKLKTIQFFDETGTVLAQRWPAQGATDIMLGTQLVVQENQEAVFVRTGKALDAFGPGRHTLTTLNMPVLKQAVGALFEDSPFQAAVYFVAKQTFIDLKWGTRQPILFRDTELAMVRLRGFGAYSLRIQDSNPFLKELVGTRGTYTTEEVRGFLRDAIVARLSDLLGENLKSILDLPAYYDELSVALKQRVAQDFARYGLETVDFYISAITPPETVMKLMDERSGMGALGDLDRYAKFMSARAISQAGEGLAKSDSGGGGAAAGAGLGAGLGLGLGAALGQTMGRALGEDVKQGNAAADPAAPAAKARFCSDCGAAVSQEARFCASCGRQLAPPAQP